MWRDFDFQVYEKLPISFVFLSKNFDEFLKHPILTLAYEHKLNSNIYNFYLFILILLLLFKSNYASASALKQYSSMNLH